MPQKISREPLEYSRHPAMRPKQDPDLLDELAYEHRHIEGLWNELQRAHRYEVEGDPADWARLGDAADQRELGRRLVEALAKHEAVEETILYPAAGRVMTEEWVNHARNDHEIIRDLLGEANGQDPGEERVFALFSEALARVEAHIEEEEKILFPIMRVEVSRGELTHPGHPDGRELMPGHPMAIDLAAAERDLEPSNGNGNGVNGRRDGKRRRLLQR